MGSRLFFNPYLFLTVTPAQSGPLDALTSKSYLKGCWSLRTLFAQSNTQPVVQLQTSSGTLVTDFYGDNTGRALRTATGQTLSAWMTANSVTTAYVKIWYDQSQYVNGGTAYNATAVNSAGNTTANTTLPFINMNTTPWSVDGSSGGWFTLSSGTVVGNGTYTFSSRVSYAVDPTFNYPLGGIIGAGINSTNQCNNLRWAYANSFQNYWFGNDFNPSKVNNVPTPTYITIINWRNTQQQGSYYTGGSNTDTYITNGYINRELATTASRSGWSFQSGNDRLMNNTNSPSLYSQMYWCINSNYAISEYDRYIIENHENDTSYNFSTFTFTNAGITGPLGPTLTNVQSSYSQTDWTQYTSNLNMTRQGIQEWRVPAAGRYMIVAAGARGGSGNNAAYSGGNAVVVSTTLFLPVNTVLYIGVGQQGTAGGLNNAGGGGGMTSVSCYNGNLTYEFPNKMNAQTTSNITYILATSGSVTSYGTSNAVGSPGWQAFDKDTATAWTSAASLYNTTNGTYSGGQSLNGNSGERIQLFNSGRAYSPYSYSLTAGSSPNDMPTSIALVVYSRINNTYSNLDSRTGLTWSANQTQTFTIASPSTSDVFHDYYLVCRTLGASNSGSVTIREVRFYVNNVGYIPLLVSGGGGGGSPYGNGNPSIVTNVGVGTLNNLESNTFGNGGGGGGMMGAGYYFSPADGSLVNTSLTSLNRGGRGTVNYGGFGGGGYGVTNQQGGGGGGGYYPGNVGPGGTGVTGSWGGGSFDLLGTSNTATLYTANLSPIVTTGNSSGYNTGHGFVIISRLDDPYFSNVRLLVNGNSNVNTGNFTDLSSLNNSLTALGSCVASTTQVKLGYTSISTGTGNYLDTSSSSNFSLGTSNFTIEFWFYGTAVTTTQRLFGNAPGSWSAGCFVIGTYNSGYIGFETNSYGSNVATLLLSNNTWYHYAAVRSGDVITQYINGTAYGSFTLTNSDIDSALGSTKKFRIGGSGNGTTSTESFSGYIENVRVTLNTPRYTTRFASPITPFSPMEFPPAPMTGNSTTISGKAYGNGTYVTSASDIFNTSYDAWYAFNYDSSLMNRWNYSGGTFTTTVDGVSVGSHWLQIQLPLGIVLTSYYLVQTDNSVSISNWIVAGSSNGSTWTEVDRRTNQTTTADPTLPWGTTIPKMYNLAITSSPYKYYRLVMYSSATGAYVMNEWHLFGY